MEGFILRYGIAFEYYHHSKSVLTARPKRVFYHGIS